jgi:hypothetical protein
MTECILIAGSSIVKMSGSNTLHDSACQPLSVSLQRTSKIVPNVRLEAAAHPCFTSPPSRQVIRLEAIEHTEHGHPENNARKLRVLCESPQVSEGFECSKADGVIF